MSNVTIAIAGRKFTVACAEGEEPHIEKLARIIDAKIEDMPVLSTQSEARCLLYAALLLADENYELKELDPLPDIAEPLETLAERLEGLASQLENAAA